MSSLLVRIVRVVKAEELYRVAAALMLSLAGVDFEEAGEKWRAGDAEKSLRFFVRAIETYDAGLQFSPSFDLAYNK